MSDNEMNTPVERLTRRLDHMVPEPDFYPTVDSIEDIDGEGGATPDSSL